MCNQSARVPFHYFNCSGKMKSMKCDVMKRNEMKWTSLPLDYTLSAFRTPLMAINCGLYILFLFFFEIIISFYLSLLFSASPTNVNTNALNISDVTARGLHFLSLSLSLYETIVYLCVIVNIILCHVALIFVFLLVSLMPFWKK